MNPLTSSPLNTVGAVTCIVHMIGGRQIRETLPEVQVEMDTAVNSAVEDILDTMTESEDHDELHVLR